MSEKDGDVSKKQLQALNEDLENYFANTIIPQLFVDGNLRLRKFTPPAMKQFTLSQEDIDKHIEDVSDNIRYPFLIENINEVIATGKIFEKEIQTTDKRWFQMNILPYIERKKKQTNGVIITFVDITKRIAVLKELEQLNSEHDTLLHTLSHDIRQPLSTITLLAEELINSYRSQDTGQFESLIETLRRASKNMKTLLEDFTGHLNKRSSTSDEDERLNIEEIYNDVAFALKDEIYTNDIDITVRFDTPEIFFSRKKLRSIVFNLLSNAIKYRRAEEPSKILVATSRDSGYIVFSMQDNGMGIDKAHQKMIFEKASRVITDVEGTGMGLYIIDKILRDKGGKIEVESFLGKGSTFTVYFKNQIEHNTGTQ